MTTAILRALLQLFDPRILAVLGACAVLSVASFLAAWFGLDCALASLVGGRFADSGWLTVLGGLLTVALAWLWFPLVASAFVALFLDRVARAVELRHYPHLPPSRGMPWAQAIASSVRFLALVLVVNLAMLGLLFFPAAYPVGYLLGNGWLLGREYFELVALRRLSPPAARSLRQRHTIEVWMAGIAVTFLLTLPLVNLVLPVLATAVMLHRFEHWRSERGVGGSPSV